MNTNNKNDYPNPDDLNTTNVVPATECTGVVRALPDNENSMDAFSEICDIPEQGNLGILEDALDIVMAQQHMNDKNQKNK